MSTSHTTQSIEWCGQTAYGGVILQGAPTTKGGDKKWATACVRGATMKPIGRLNAKVCDAHRGAREVICKRGASEAYRGVSGQKRGAFRGASMRKRDIFRCP